MASPFEFDIAIRPMRDEDLARVSAIDQISFSQPWPDDAYRYELHNNPNSRSFVAEIRKTNGVCEVVGVIVVWLILDEAHIATLAVDPFYRSKGVGRKLVAEAMIDAVRQGANVATLEVRASNDAARSLYQDFGFQVAGRRLRYYQDNGEDAILMTLDGLGEMYLERFIRQ
jgi:ribosomal-protein-alanine N-acetyltransferase